MLAAIRVLNRLELVAETLRAALNELATVAPEWLQPWHHQRGTSAMAADRGQPPAQDQAERAAYAQTVGEDGFALLDALASARGARSPRTRCRWWRRCGATWQRHYERRRGGRQTLREQPPERPGPFQGPIAN